MASNSHPQRSEMLLVLCIIFCLMSIETLPHDVLSGFENPKARAYYRGTKERFSPQKFPCVMLTIAKATCISHGNYNLG